MTQPTIIDQLNRPLQDLRISVIDRCNFRCPYCMPEDEIKNHSFLKQTEWLTYEEITRLTKLFVQLGVSKVRITGGEPLLRPNLEDLIEKLSDIDEIQDLTLTTNGSLLSEQAETLRMAGLTRLTISLDALDSRTFDLMNGGRGNLKDVLNAINKAELGGFESLKINVVVQRGVNDSNILKLVNYFKGTPHVLRFIEYMDVGSCNHWENKYVVSSKEIISIINEVYPIEPIESNYFGEVAKRYSFKDGQGELGFISSVSQPFCQDCTRARISTDGQFFTCLFATKGVDLKTPLRSGATNQELLDLITNVWNKREDRYSELRASQESDTNIGKRIEMFQIGG